MTWTNPTDPVHNRRMSIVRSPDPAPGFAPIAPDAAGMPLYRAVRRALLRSIEEGKLPPGLVALHWFSRDEVGRTHVRSAELDDAGAFGDWPEDFAEVALDAQARYLDAAERRLTSRKR